MIINNDGYISLRKLSSIIGVEKSSLRTFICKPSFSKFLIGEKRYKVKYCLSLMQDIKEFLENKKGRQIRYDKKAFANI